MASASAELELEQKEPLNEGGRSNQNEPKNGAADASNGNEITMEEFRGKLDKEGSAAKKEQDAEAADTAAKTGFGGSWKCCVMLSIGLLLAIIFTVVVAVVSSQRTMSESSDGATDRKSSVYQHAAVVTDVEICSIMGKDILKQGGSAVDAAITCQLCIGLVNGQSSGLGGGFFMVIYEAATGTSQYIDARETAPSAANEAYAAGMLAAGTPTGINSTAVPGEVLGLWDAHQSYGKLSWEDLFVPVIELAENGYQATAHLEDTLSKMNAVKPLRDYEGAWDIYMREDGSYKREGDLVKNIALANTMRALSVNGSDEFYFGATAQKMIDEVEQLGGILTLQDLNTYSVLSGEASRSQIPGGMTLLAPPSPSGGPVLQFIVNVMSAFNLTRDDFVPGPALVKTYHRFLEASRFGFGLRSRVGGVITPNVQQALDALSSVDYAREIAASIPSNRVFSTNSSYYSVIPQITTTLGGTSHVNVLAANGDAVSSTTSVNYRFGSKIRSPSTGIIYNNDMSDFSFDPSSPNYVRPGQRPLSAMSACIVIDNDGRVKLVEGSAGSKKIITMNAWMIISTLLGEVPLSQAVDGKRIHAELRPEIREIYETGFDQDIIDELTAMGHELTEQTTIFGVVQAILRSDHEILAYSDPRKGGKTAGY